MNCCDSTEDCHQGRDCPIRRGYGTRKVRAGAPVAEDLPISYAAGHEDDERVPDEPDFVGVAIFIVVVSIVFAVASITIGGRL